MWHTFVKYNYELLREIVKECVHKQLGGKRMWWDLGWDLIQCEVVDQRLQKLLSRMIPI